ncbi:MAG: hypothetical protein DBX55_03635 [Verrucomicrobia bacterium]|nr:MAG: hypothetical protein DBX55_03635 [Verrucomicrobiota bacterium]
MPREIPRAEARQFGKTRRPRPGGVSGRSPEFRTPGAPAGDGEFLLILPILRDYKTIFAVFTYAIFQIRLSAC